MWYLLYKNRDKGLQIEFWLVEGAGNEGPSSNMGYSVPTENKVPRKASDVDTQSQLDALERWDLQGKNQSSPLPVDMMFL